MTKISRHFNRKASDQRRIQRLRNLISLVPEGRALFEFADTVGIEFRFDGRLSRHDGGFCDDDSTIIRLNRKWPKRKCVEAICHEIRHIWQDHTIGHTPVDYLKPYEFLLLNRLKEGDAYAYSSLIVKKLNSLLGKKFPAQFPVRKNMSDAAHLNTVFRRFQKSEMSGFYDDNARGYAEDVDPRDQTKTLSRAFNNLSRLISAGLPETSFAYLDAVNLRDFKKKLAAYIPEETRADAKSFSMKKA